MKKRQEYQIHFLLKMEKSQFENGRKKLQKPTPLANPIKLNFQPSELKLNFRLQAKQKCNTISSIIEVFQGTTFQQIPKNICQKIVTFLSQYKEYLQTNERRQIRSCKPVKTEEVKMKEEDQKNTKIFNSRTLTKKFQIHKLPLTKSAGFKEIQETQKENGKEKSLSALSQTEENKQKSRLQILPIENDLKQAKEQIKKLRLEVENIATDFQDKINQERKKLQVMSSYLKDKENSMVHLIRAFEERYQSVFYQNNSYKITII